MYARRLLLPFLPFLSAFFVLTTPLQAREPIASKAKPAAQPAANSLRSRQTGLFTPNYARGPEMDNLNRWRRLPVRVWFDSQATAYTSERRRAVLKGFDLWSRATGGAVAYLPVPTERQADMVIRFVPGSYVGSDPNSIGRTGTRIRNGFVYKGFMELATSNTTLDGLTETAAHEWGHALGINGHSTDPNDLMYRSAIRYIVEQGAQAPPHVRRVPTERDVNTLKTAYALLFAKN